jgi:hypothetical protein
MLHLHIILYSDLLNNLYKLKEVGINYYIEPMRETDDDNKHAVNYLFKSFDKHYLNNHYERNVIRDAILKGSRLRRYGRSKDNHKRKEDFATKLHLYANERFIG